MSWILFPLYGLKIREANAWLDAPLFGDATLVSRSALKAHLGPDASPMLSHSKLSEALGESALDDPRFPPSEQLVEIEPPSYVAVRDRGDTSKNTRRAAEIRAFLSGTLALRARQIQAVATSPEQVAWFIAPGRVVLDAANPVKTSIAPKLNEHALVKPLEVSQSDLRMSLKHGLVIPNANDWPWDIHNAHPVCQLFLGKTSKFQRRLLDAAVLIQEASCAGSYPAQLQLAVAALEVLLKPGSFSGLAGILKAFFQGAEQARRVDDVLQARHRVTHEGAGRGDENGQVKLAARHAITFAWLMLDIVAAFDRGEMTVAFDDYVDLLATAIRLDERVARMAAAPSNSCQRIIYDVNPSFMKFLTVRIDVGTNSAL